MLLQRITNHIRAQNWFAVGTDFAIVVVGVFIGIQVSNWNDARIENQKGDYFAAQLLQDLHLESAIYEQELSYFSTVHDYAIRTIELIDKDNRELDNEFVVSAYNATQYIHSESARTNFDGLIATGNLRLIRDELLRTAALSVYTSLSRTTLYKYVRDSAFRERVRRLIPHDVQHAIREQCGDIRDEVTGWISGIRASCRIDFERERIAAAAAILRNDTRLPSDLAFFLSTLGAFISDTAAARRQLEQRLNDLSVDPEARSTD